MNILICGDIVGRAGREVVKNFLPEIMSENNIKFVVANGERCGGSFQIISWSCACRQEGNLGSGLCFFWHDENAC